MIYVSYNVSLNLTQIAVVPFWRLGHSGKTPDFVRSSLAGIQIGLVFRMENKILKFGNTREKDCKESFVNKHI